MSNPTTAKLRIGAWNVEPELGCMTRDGDTVRLEPRTLRLLLCLAERAGRTVSADQLLGEVWTGVVVSPDSVYQAIASLRRLLGDDPKQPSYIMTVPRKGYRLVADVGMWSEPGLAPPSSHEPEPESGRPVPEVPQAVGAQPAPDVLPAVVPPAPALPGKGAAGGTRRIAAAVGVTLAVVVGVASWMHDRPGGISAPGTQVVQPPQKSVAVFPFLDLTDEMKQEYFADGITEELIGRFSDIPGFKVPAPTASFFYKGKQITVEEFARKLGVRYVLDGSVRKAGDTLRISARLMKADNGFVIWSATYNRPVGDLLMVQDDIGEQVARALETTISDKSAALAKSQARQLHAGERRRPDVSRSGQG
jgi:TolB-like protein/DNA-binding winged helix-turn-helix (wHTH) protein